MSIADSIKKGEGKKLEFKEVLPESSKIVKTVIAFSNGAGGKLIIGVRDKSGEIIGISDEDALELPDRISNIIYDSCYPTIVPEIYVENIHRKSILVVEVYPGNLKPYYIKLKGKLKGTYIRVGATNKLADEETIIELERQKRNISFDEELLYDYDYNNLDLTGLKNDLGRFINKEISDNDLLNLKLIKEENGSIRPTKAIILLADKSNYYEYARIKCARFKGKDIEEFIDQKEFSGPLYTQVEDAMNFAKIYIAKSGQIKGLQRKDEYEIPLVAIREALINAVVHRDYSITGSDIKFAIFDNRIEITSPGNLPKSLDIEDIKEGRSEIRNKTIARFFKEIRFVEQWGTGIRRIISACKEANLKEPDFLESGLFFKVIIYSKYADKVPISTDKVPISTDKLNKNELAVINYLKEKSQITNKELRDITGLSDSGAKKLLGNLVDKKVLKAVGERKNRYYKLNGIDIVTEEDISH